MHSSSLSPLQVDPVFARQSAFKHIFYLPPSLRVDFRAREKSYLILTAIQNLKALSYWRGDKLGRFMIISLHILVSKRGGLQVKQFPCCLKGNSVEVVRQK